MNNILKRNLYQVLILLVIMLFLGTSFRGNDDIYDRINRNMEVFGRVYKEIAINYVDDIDVDKFMREGIEGLLKTLDPYTVYFDQNAKGEMDLIISGKYGGIGVTINKKDSFIIITNVMNGYEAQRKGLRTGDKILSVNGIDLTGAVPETVNKLVKGIPGSELKMVVERDEQIIEFNLTREEIILKNISYSGFLGNESDGIAYFRLDRFTSSAEDEVVSVIKTLQSKAPVKSLIIDLRDNGGGLLESATGILNKLVPRNSLLVITKGKKKDSEIKYFSKEDPLISRDVPVILLVNKNTASASEIMAGAIQDLDRGVLIGVRTFGKGLVQQIKDIDADAKLKMTISRYYTPSGRWIQEKNYFKDNKFGVFLNKEAYIQTDFKTLGGRTVYANGGITPDVVIDTEQESEINTVLLSKDMYFKFGNYYLRKNPAPNIFKCTDADFEEFKNFLNTNNFLYKSEAYNKIEELRSIATKRGYSSGFSQDLDRLSADLNSEYESDLEKAKEEIKQNIESEINRRIVTEKEQIESLFPFDKQLQEALRLIKNIEEYNKLLTMSN